MTKIIKVESCGKCPYSRSGDELGSRVCFRYKIVLTNATGVYGDCPLQNYEDTDSLKKQNQIMKSALEDMRDKCQGAYSIWAETVLKKCEEIV